MTHKTNIIFASFLLMQPAIDRAVDQFFDEQFIMVWLITYVILFSLFIWYYKRIKWQFAVGFLIWLAELINLILKGDL